MLREQKQQARKHAGEQAARPRQTRPQVPTPMHIDDDDDAGSDIIVAVPSPKRRQEEEEADAAAGGEMLL